ncbi:hypothetical protein Tco_0337009 [Tanacetum coccineum]
MRKDVLSPIHKGYHSSLHHQRQVNFHEEHKVYAHYRGYNILVPMRYVSKADDYQVYGALLPEVMINQKMRGSPSYKTYLAFTTSATSPKKARKYKKHASPSRKRTFVTVEEEEPKPAKKVVPSKKPVLDEPKGKSVGTDKRTGLKPRVPDMSKTDSFESENKSWGDSVCTYSPNYVPTDDETNDESNDVDEEEYDRIDKELYGDVNVRLAYTKQDDEGEEDAYMTDVAHVQYVVQATTTTTPAIHNATTEVPPFSSSHSVSSNYTSAFLNLKNLQSTKTELVSMLDINVQHEVLHTSPLLTIPIFVLKKHDADIIKEFSVPATIVERLTQQYLPQQSTEKSTEDIQKIKMEHASKQQVPKFIITSSDTATLEILIRKLPCVVDKLKKRKPDDADKEEGPFAGSD